MVLSHCYCLNIAMTRDIILMFTFLTLSTYGQQNNVPEACQKFSVHKNFTREVQLMECLFRHYRSDIRPAIDHSQKTVVNISFYLVALAQIRDRENAISLESYVGQRWFDYRLKWNPEEWGGVKKLFTKYYTVWEPELIVWDKRKGATLVEGNQIIIHHTGELVWDNQMRLNSYCHMTYEKFPFDRQDCIFYLQHQVYDSDLVDMQVVYPTEIKMPAGTCYSLKDEWKIDTCKVKVERGTFDEMNTSFITLEVTMERQYLYHFYLIIIPSILVVLITLSLFWLPHESNQRHLTAGGILFVILLMNFLLQQFLPPGLGNVPTIASYLLYCIFLVITVVAISLITQNLHSKDPREETIPGFVRKVFFSVVVEKATFVTPFVSMPDVSAENKFWNETIQRGQDPFSPGSRGGVPNTVNCGQNTEKLMEDIRKHVVILLNTSTKTPMNEWKQLALIIDRLSFYIFFFLNIIISAAVYAH